MFTNSITVNIIAAHGVDESQKRPNIEAKKRSLFPPLGNNYSPGALASAVATIAFLRALSQAAPKAFLVGPCVSIKRTK